MSTARRCFLAVVRRLATGGCTSRDLPGRGFADGTVGYSSARTCRLRTSVVDWRVLKKNGIHDPSPDTALHTGVLALGPHRLTPAAGGWPARHWRLVDSRMLAGPVAVR